MFLTNSDYYERAMRSLAFALLFLSAYDVLAFPTKNFEKLAERAFTATTYNQCDPEKILKMHKKAEQPAQLGLEYLKCKRIQEAIWTYELAGFPKAAELLKEKLKQTLESSNFQVTGAIGAGVSCGYYIKYENGIEAVLKPADGGWNNPIENEVFTYEFDQAIELHRVPVTVFNMHEARSVSIQYKMLQATTSNHNYRDTNYSDLPFVNEVYLIDYVLSNTDRHYGNSLLTAEGYLVLIDNGRMFGANNIPLPSDQKQKQLKIPRRLLEKLYEMDRTFLKKKFGKLITKENIDLILTKIDEIKAVYPLKNNGKKTCSKHLEPAA